MGGAVCLRRNYADLPFSLDSRADVAQAVNERVLPVLEKEEDTFTYLMVQQMEPEQRRVLIAHGLLDPDSADNALSSAYLRQDDRLCVQTAAADHLRIAAYDEDGSLSDCLALCLPLEQALEADHPYARSAQYGCLTARPCDAGGRSALKGRSAPAAREPRAAAGGELCAGADAAARLALFHCCDRL